jgi:hypothetical protein
MNEPDFELGAALSARELNVRVRTKAETRTEGVVALTRDERTLAETEEAREAYYDAEVERHLEGHLRSDS